MPMAAVRFDDEDGARWITIARPPLNVLDIATIEELSAAVAPLFERRDPTEMILTGAPLNATEAARAGLITRVVPDLEAETRRVVRLLAAKSAVVLGLARRALREGAYGPFPEALDRVERLYRDELVSTDDME